MRAYKLKKCKRVHGLHFAPDGTRLLAVGGAEVRMVDSAVWLDLATGENTGRIDQFANCYAVDPGLTRYALGGANHWNRALASVQWAALDGPGGWHGLSATRGVPPSFRDVSGLAFDPVGERLAVGHTRPARWRGPREVIHQISVVRIGAVDERTDMSTSEPAGVIVFDAAGTRLATTGGVDGDTTARVFDLDVGQQALTFYPPGTVTRSVQLLPDGRLLVANGRSVYALPRTGGDPLYTLSDHPKQVNAVTLTPDGRRILTASHDGSIRTWDATTGEPGPAFDWQIGPVTAVAFAPDGLTCAAAGLNGKVVVWDVDG